ncbi:helix-turn-helix transcriptional regulator [Lentiprolixibacter aurantiacus]|uniref:Helix-turn-helix transcriptional regulator n=1 Tax=Lentiprolixibacter aurantiacus TaxID=2993939 RepID=A0AAE3MKB1_9FLAO|nr:helix-turn-helix transcriptional regulator [Lentiprolixibacter aurantiacus]MCX2718999.1 helix-turn-helix transcriptional regulator [Lentiprolixibacter aurantiacus]
MKNTIKINRARLGLTQADLAVKVQVSRQTINAMELGKYAPSTILSLKLSDIFDVPVNELFMLEEGDWQ